MPTYDFYCHSCDDFFEVRRSMQDTSKVTHVKCGGLKTQQVYLSAPMTFARNIDHPDSPLDDLPNAPQMRAAAQSVVRKALRESGHTL